MKKFYNFLAAILAVGMVSVGYAQPSGLSLDAPANYCPGTTGNTNYQFNWVDDAGANDVYRIVTALDAAYSVGVISHASTAPDATTQSYSFATLVGGQTYYYKLQWDAGNTGTFVDVAGEEGSFDVVEIPDAVSSVVINDADNDGEVVPGTIEICSAVDFTLTASAPTLGDNGEYWWDDDNDFSNGQGIYAGENTADLFFAGGITGGPITVYVRTHDPDCNNSATAAYAITVNDNGAAITSLSFFTGQSTNDVTCLGDAVELQATLSTLVDGFGTDYSHVAYVANHTSGPTVLTDGDNDGITDGGFTIPNSGEVYDFTVSLSQGCNLGWVTYPRDTLIALQGATAAPTNTDLEYSTDGGATWLAYTAPLTVCDGDDLDFRFDTAGFTGIVGEDPNTTIGWDFDADASTTYDAIPTEDNINPLDLTNNPFTFNTGALTSGNAYILRVQVTDGCTGTIYEGAADVTINVNVAGDAAGTTLSMLREDNATPINTNDFVCDGELIDIELDLATDLGTNGEYRVYKTTDGGVTFTSILLEGANIGVSPLTITDHNQGSVTADYHFVIVNDCDSLTQADGMPAQVRVNVSKSQDFTADPFAFSSATLDDDIACTDEDLTMIVKVDDLANDGSVVTFYSDVNPPVVGGSGTEVMLGLGSLNAADSTFSYFLADHLNVDVYYYAEISGGCVNPSVIKVSNLIGTHTPNTLPTDIDAVDQLAADLDVDDDQIGDDVCVGTTVTLSQGFGALSDDGSDYEWRVSLNAGATWTVIDTAATVDSTLTLPNQTYLFDVRIVGGECGDITPAAVQFQISTNTSSDTLNITSIEERNGADVILAGYDVPSKTGADVICNTSDVVLNFPAFDYTASTDGPELDIRVGGVTVTGGYEALAGQDLSGGFERVVNNADLSDGAVITVYYNSACLAAEVLVGTFTVTYKDDNAAATMISGAIAAVKPDGNPSANAGAVVLDGEVICAGEDVVLTIDGTLGDTTNFNAGVDGPYYEWSLDGFVSSSFKVYADTGDVISFAEIAANDMWVDATTDAIATTGIDGLTTASVRIVNGCNDVSGTVFTFTVDAFSASTPFTSISLDNDNFCADEGITATMIANGAPALPAIAKVEWWTIDDEGNPELLIQDLAANAPGALTIAPTPTVTTTYGARIIVCYDTTAFEVRTVNVKDLPDVTGASISASPSGVCDGGSSTMTIVDHVLGTNGNVVWYDDAAMTTKLATGPSYTATGITGNQGDIISFFAFVEADCDTVGPVQVDITIDNVQPGTVATVALVSASPNNCEGSDITVTATDNAPVTGSHIWEVSKNGGVSFETLIPTADNFTFSDFTNITYDVNGEATIVFRASKTNGCFTTTTTQNSIVVRQNPGNLVSLVATATTICTGNNADLTVTTGDLGYQGVITWSADGTFTDMGAEDGNAVITVAPTATTTYSVKVVGACGESDVKTITINVNEPAVVSSLDLSAASICDDDIVNISSTLGNPGTPAATLQYQVSYDGVTFSDINAANLIGFNAWNNVNYTAGIGSVDFKVIATNVCGTSEATNTLTVNKAPEAVSTITVSAIEACITDNTPISIAYLGGDLGVDGVVTWSAVAGGVLQNETNTGAEFVPSANAAATYTIDLTISSAICAVVTAGATTTADITVHPQPVNGLGDPITTLCSGDAGVDLTAVTGYNVNGSFSANAKTLGSLVGNSYTAPVSASSVVDTITYSITENGCTETFEVYVEINGTPSVAITSVTNTTCGLNDGEIVAVASNGSSSNYEYSLDAGFASFQTNDGTFSGLGAGGYTVYVRNVGALCVVSADTVVQAIGAFTIDAITVNDVSCLNGDNGSIEVEISGGVSPYNYYLIADDGVNPLDTTSELATTATSHVFGGLVAGVDYDIVIEDVNCKSTTTGIVLNDGTQINLTVSDFEHVVCPGDATGSFNLEADKAGYTGDFEFSLDGGATFFSNTEVTGLEAGVYEIIVRDDSDCEANFFFSLEEPTAFDFDVQVDSVDVNSWDIEITNVVGGTGVKEVSLDGGAYDQIFTFTDLADGEHTITIRDEEGCTYSRTITLGTPVGIEELKAVTEVSTFPNPFNNEITVVGLGIENATIMVTDLYGKQIAFTANSNENEVKINAADWANGVYLIHVSGDNFNSTERVIKK